MFANKSNTNDNNSSNNKFSLTENRKVDEGVRSFLAPEIPQNQSLFGPQ